ncbi:MAG: hypothetical protein IBX55_10515 [Methyloprofundus sp.]|nr:hypothetical protein [Methyloprofundus sp.]
MSQKYLPGSVLLTNKSQLLGMAAVGAVVGLTLISGDASANSVPQNINIQVGDIIGEGDAMDTMLRKIMGWVIVVLSAIAMAGAALGYVFSLWQGFQKLQDDNEHKSYKMGQFITTAIVGIIMVSVVVVIGMVLYNYGASVRG